jgi:hypothetical protein
MTLFDVPPRQSTVRLRECKGSKLKYCQWGSPAYHTRMAWPFNLNSVLKNTYVDWPDTANIHSSGGSFIFQAKCVDEDTYIGRGTFLPGLKCT